MIDYGMERRLESEIEDENESRKAFIHSFIHPLWVWIFGVDVWADDDDDGGRERKMPLNHLFIHSFIHSLTNSFPVPEDSGGEEDDLEEVN